MRKGNTGISNNIIETECSKRGGGFHPVGGGGSFPPKTPSFPPKRKERKKKRGKGEKEREREGGGEGGRGEHVRIFFGAAIQVISNLLVKLFLRALDKTTQYIPFFWKICMRTDMTLDNYYEQLQ
jgi:hypothetical protein